MYANELLDAYKQAQNYVQDKQIAHDLNLSPQKLCKIRKGIRYISDEEAIFLAEGAGLDPELALLGCHADRNDNPQIKAMWNSIAKKFDGRGLQGISMACTGLVMWIGSPNEAIAKCVLSGFKLNGY